MEFGSEERIWGARDVHTDSIVGAEDAKTLSFCDMPTYDIAGKSTYRVSNADSSEHDDFQFDLDFMRSTSVSRRTSTADDLFQNGRLLPLTRHNTRYSYSDPTLVRENGLLQASKVDLAESKPSYCTSTSPDNSQVPHRSFSYSVSQKGVRRVNSTAASNKSKGMANLTSFRSPNPSGSWRKTFPTWLRILTLGIMKTPVMKLEDNLKWSVSSYYKKERPLVNKVVTFQQKSKSVKYDKQAQETPKPKGFRIFRLFSLFTSCKSSINSVIGCSNDKKCIDMEASLHARRSHNY